ncbi:hypothetical protein D3C81_1922440 [compost metagenome]
MQLKGQPADRTGLQVLHLQHQRTITHRSGQIELLRLAADNLSHQVLRVGIANSFAAHQLAVAHDRHLIGYAKNFVQPVRHINHAHTALAQPLEHLEQALCIVRRQARGRLIEDQ